MSNVDACRGGHRCFVALCALVVAVGCDERADALADAAPIRDGFAGAEAGPDAAAEGPDLAVPDAPMHPPPSDGASDADVPADSNAVRDDGARPDLPIRVPDGATADAEPPDTASGDPPPDAARPDVDLPDAAAPDGVVADAAQLDAPLLDAARPDLPLPDGALPDLPLPDAALPDLPLPDAALPDVPLPDAALPDLPLPDAALPDAAPPPPDPLAVDELVPENRGTAVDANGDARPWVEVVARDDGPVDLALWSLAVVGEPPWALADQADPLDAGQRRLVFLPFSVPRGATLRFIGPDVARDIDIPVDLPVDHALARFGEHLERCRWATPGAPNGDACEAPPWPEAPAAEDFVSVALPEPYPARPRPLVVTELGLHPAPGFVEVLNAGAEPVALEGWSVRVAAQPAGEAWPTGDAGAELTWPVGVLAPGERATLAVLPR